MLWDNSKLLCICAHPYQQCFTQFSLRSQDTIQFDEVNMFISYVSYRHALKTFEVELCKWEMEVGLMHITILHSAMLRWEKEMFDKLRKFLGLEPNLLNVFIQPTHLEEDAKVTLVP